ncbi:hypothetical protein TWF225_009389 [Orbilia oligospora]|nr:hypothetical protein TWF225_009389 [Orbilia oligospora]KAF3270034.1 hypothetical protein TWF217_008376 [Orbilia oligospora]KAF3270500.1 hypothetical protein TWF128_004265 [Orbilia oligospora]KAF3298014.1 hypothetical protein TWF132_004158 [Orbilia oligospora]
MDKVLQPSSLQVNNSASPNKHGPRSPKAPPFASSCSSTMTFSGKLPSFRPSSRNLVAPCSLLLDSKSSDLQPLLMFSIYETASDVLHVINLFTYSEPTEDLRHRGNRGRKFNSA